MKYAGSTDDKPSKVRMGFFKANVFVDPLRNIEQILAVPGLESMLDDSTKDEIEGYITERSEKMRKQTKSFKTSKGIKSPMDDLLLLSEDEDIGQQLKDPIVDRGSKTNVSMFNVPPRAESSELKLTDNGSMPMCDNIVDKVYDVREVKMQ